MAMKKILIFLLVIAAITGACENQEIEFPDFEYKAVYFPLQYPFRTLVLGDDRFDNSMDKELKFSIGAIIGGMYKNTKTWSIDYIIDPTLAENLYNGKIQRIYELPKQYYTLSPENTMTIPAGSFNGLIQVQLTEAFLDDPLAISGQYVIPVRITGTNADSILSGVPIVENPKKIISTHWEASNQPKDFILYGIKYINPLHGNYLHRGKDVTYNASNEVINEVVYSQPYVEKDQLWQLTTTGRYVVNTNGVGINVGGRYSMKLTFDDSGNIQIASVSNSPILATGTGKYVKDGGEWGGQKHNAIFLEYSYLLGGNNHIVNDTLVFRDNGVKFEQNTIITF
jgi:hypothetical protein